MSVIDVPAAAILRALVLSFAIFPAEVFMSAMQKIEDYVRSRATPAAARELNRLLEALKEEKEYPLSSLYEIDYEAFELAVEALRDWRIARYYAGPGAGERRGPAATGSSGAA